MSTPVDALFGPIFRLLPSKRFHQASADAGDGHTPQPDPVDDTNSQHGQPRGTPLTRSEIRQSYDRGPSFSRYLPFVEYLAESGCFLLEDGMSVGIAAEIRPVPTEGRSQDALSAVRDQIESGFQDGLPEYDNNPWVIQIFARDEIDPTHDVNALRAHAAPHLADDAFTQAWLNGMADHLHTISRPGGIFHDDRITNTRWRGQTRRVRLLLYRWLGSSVEAPVAEDEANRVYDRVTAALSGSGVHIERMDGAAVQHWLLPWFNPAPASDPDDPDPFYQRMTYPGDDEIAALAHYDLGEDVIHNNPVGDVETGVWYFDGLPHRAIPVEEMRRAPDVGHITGEMSRSKGQAYNAIMDQLPEDTIMALTIVATPQEPLEDHINRLRAKAVGDSVKATQVRHDCDKARAMLAEQHKLYQYALTFFIRGDNDADLRRRMLTLTTQLQQAKLKPVAAEDEVAPLNTYLRWLPMAYDPAEDKHAWYTQLAYVQHLANLTPFFGRSRGTGHPGLSFFNRGGGTFSFDPLSLDDRAKNGHMLIFGPTGAGKSATLNAIFSQVMALRKPRLFIIEVGNSFGLLADDLARHGLSVNKVKLAPGAAPPLPLFADAHRLLAADAAQARSVFDRADDRHSDEPAPVAEDEDDDSERDLLGEMEITARLMITGGDAKEDAEFRRSDRRLVRDAIYNAAVTTKAENRQCLAEDVRNALYALSRSEDLPDVRRAKAHDMAESMGLLCDGFDGQVFNREGDAWPECDVTVVDLAHYSRDGYEAQLALSVISLTNIIIGIAERDQYSGRPIIQAIDECHVVTVNPLLSPYLVKAGKMGRKLSYWIWLATQNLEDFPDAATRLLNMIEWYVCLVTPPDEIEQLARFKTLSADQKQLIRSATKANGKYTEGVVLADRLEALFRIVPQSRYLALAGTEGEEKAERRQVMNELGCSELDAALHIAAKMDEARGMKSTAGANHQGAS
ncbi:conjugative transfer ATPase [Salinisphaera sp. T31B1]|uniref:conjugative transfer ATPase n=1 Tax=Salinisphaera sp. T31B1 TaxID=727963 RepID=UPI00333EDF25